MKILVVLAHPDYAEFYIGGTLAKHAARGDEVHVVSVSAGELGHPTLSPKDLAGLNERESKAAAKFTGIKEVRYLEFKDTEIFNTPGLRRILVDIIRELGPDIVITHWYKDAHPDLRETALATIDSCTYSIVGGIKTNHLPHAVKKLYTFCVPSGVLEFEPEIFVDITDVMDKKVEAIKCHKATIDAFYGGNPEKLVKEISTENGFWGQRSRVQYAEAFREVNLAMHLGTRALGYLPV